MGKFLSGGMSKGQASDGEAGEEKLVLLLTAITSANIVPSHFSACKKRLWMQEIVNYLKIY